MTSQPTGDFIEEALAIFKMNLLSAQGDLAEFQRDERKVRLSLLRPLRWWQLLSRLHNISLRVYRDNLQHEIQRLSVEIPQYKAAVAGLEEGNYEPAVQVLETIAIPRLEERENPAAQQCRTLKQQLILAQRRNNT